MEGGSRQSTYPYRVNHHDRNKDCHYPWEHGMGTVAILPGPQHGDGSSPYTWLWRGSWIPDWSEQVSLELAAL